MEFDSWWGRSRRPLFVVVVFTTLSRVVYAGTPLAYSMCSAASSVVQTVFARNRKFTSAVS